MHLISFPHFYYVQHFNKNINMHTNTQKHKIPVLLLNLVFELDNTEPQDTTTQHNSLTQRTW